MILSMSSPTPSSVTSQSVAARTLAKSGQCGRREYQILFKKILKNELDLMKQFYKCTVQMENWLLISDLFNPFKLK